MMQVDTFSDELMLIEEVIVEDTKKTVVRSTIVNKMVEEGIKVMAINGDNDDGNEGQGCF